jgi:hypothetical protein
VHLKGAGDSGFSKNLQVTKQVLGDGNVYRAGQPSLAGQAVPGLNPGCGQAFLLKLYSRAKVLRVVHHYPAFTAGSLLPAIGAQRHAELRGSLKNRGTLCHPAPGVERADCYVNMLRHETRK